MKFIRSGNNSVKSDEELIAYYLSSRDPAVIDIFFNRYCHLVYAVSYKYLKNEEDSKDLVIQIFEKLPVDLVKYEIHNFSSWLHTVTRNSSLRYLSSNRKFTTGVENIPEETNEDEDEFKELLLPHLLDSIKELNDAQRMCIELFYLENMSYQEIHEKTDFTLKEVKSHIQNGKRNLRIILEKKTHDNRKY